MWSENWHPWYYDALPCAECGAKVRGGGCGSGACPLLRFRGAGLPGRKPWESNWPVADV